MCDTEGNKRICIPDNLPDCQRHHQHIHLKEKKKVSLYTNSKIIFLKRNFHLLKTLKIKSLTCFMHQINIIVAIFVLWKFLPSNQPFE